MAPYVFIQIIGQSKTRVHQTDDRPASLRFFFTYKPIHTQFPQITISNSLRFSRPHLAWTIRRRRGVVFQYDYHVSRALCDHRPGPPVPNGGTSIRSRNTRLKFCQQLHTREPNWITIPRTFAFVTLLFFRFFVGSRLWRMVDFSSTAVLCSGQWFTDDQNLTWIDVDYCSSYVHIQKKRWFCTLLNRTLCELQCFQYDLFFSNLTPYLLRPIKLFHSIGLRGYYVVASLTCRIVHK